MTKFETLQARINAARLASDPEANFILNAMKEQLLIVMVNKLGGKVDIPVTDIDGTGAWLMSMAVNPATGVFTFETERKQ